MVHRFYTHTSRALGEPENRQRGENLESVEKKNGLLRRKTEMLVEVRRVNICAWALELNSSGDSAEQI